MSRYFILAISLFCLLSCKNTDKEQSIDLAGDWQFALDPDDKGVKEGWFNKNLEGIIKLPGSLQEQGFGNDPDINTEWTGGVADRAFFTDEKYEKFRKKENFKIPFWLQPEKHYVGVAWYQKEINIPNDWEGKPVFLNLERPHWETTLYVDGKEIGKNTGLGMPHVYELKGLAAGKHLLSVRVDNKMTIPVGINAHSISDHTQSNWNGITGKIFLEAKPRVYVNHVSIYPDVQNKKIRVVAEVINSSGINCNGSLGVQAVAENMTASDSKEYEWKPGLNTVESEVMMGENVVLWSEFTPQVYKLTVKAASEGSLSEKTESFGMREFKKDGRRFAINGTPVFLRGTLECCIFPLTGYPSQDPAYWEKIYKTVKNHGLNHVRFHSWCPPRVAFDVADREGVYLQVECNVWVNVNIGDGEYIDKWIYEEGDRILREYGNHPSFCLMTHGNEPSGANQAQYLSGLVAHWKEQDNRRVYSSSGGWPYIENADFWNAPDPRIHWWAHGLESVINAEAPRTDFDFEQVIMSKNMPTVSHEIGQWCAYPNFKEIEKYKGVLKAKNFEIFKETLEENHMGDLAEAFLMASGKLQTLCYKADIEAALRTREFAGFQLLDLHDFPGQGTALVGVLDPFWDSKGYVTPEEYSKFCNSTVPLARMHKLIWGSNEIFKVAIEVSHFASAEVKNAAIEWSITNDEGKVLKNGSFKADLPVTNCINIGEIEFPLNGITTAGRLTLNVTIPEHKAENNWHFWVYPDVSVDNNGIYITDKFDNKTQNILQSGGSVLLTLKPNSLKENMGGNITVGFSTIFWNTAWTLKQAPHVLGIYCNPEHPALEKFPTEYHSDYQWWEIVTKSNAMVLDKFPADFRPIVHFVDDWFENRKLGLVMEAKVGNGKLIVTGADLITDIDKRLAAKQLKYSLIEYMKSDRFDPAAQIEISKITELLK